MLRYVAFLTGCFHSAYIFYIHPWYFVAFFKKRSYLVIFRQEEGREKEREKHQCVVASHRARTGDLACNPGMCPDWELNW